MNDETFRYILITTIVIVPVLAVTARFAMKPIVEAIARLQEVMREHETATKSREVEELRAETARLREELLKLSESEKFHRELAEQPRHELPRSQ